MQELFFSERGIYYRINEFRPGRPTLVFIHGLSGSSSAWAPYEQKFERNYNILTFDLRGHGKSLKPKNLEDYEIHKFADDIHALTSHLGIKKFILLSHSLGTLIALEFLSRYQGQVASAVFLSPVFSVSKRRLARLIRPLFGLVRLIDIFPFPFKPGSHVDYSKYQNSGDWNIRRMFADIRNTSLRVYLYCTKQSYKLDCEDFLDKIKMPVLIVHGKKDTISPVENSLVMAEKIKSAKLVLLENTDHIIVLNNFTEVSEVIENFIAETKASAAP